VQPAGDIVAAQHDAHEALRLVAGLHASLEAVGAAGPPTEDAHRLQGVTFWRLQGVPAYVTRLLNHASNYSSLRFVPQHALCISRDSPAAATRHFSDKTLPQISFASAELRLASLLQTGRLMEMSSSPEEALWSFQEAHTLVRLFGFGDTDALCPVRRPACVPGMKEGQVQG